jgi:hypothetical protein
MKKLVIASLFTLFSISLFAQSPIVGGAGNCTTTGNPNLNPTFNNPTGDNICKLIYDKTNNKWYAFDITAVAGSKYVEMPVDSARVGTTLKRTAAGLIVVDTSSVQIATKYDVAKAIIDTVYYVISGQSNAVGWGTDSPLASNTVNSKVEVFNTATQAWEVATPTNIHDTQEPTNAPFAAGSNSIAWEFAKKIQNQNPKKHIRFILVGKVGEPISGWVGGSPIVYNRLLTNMTAAGIKKIDGFIWMQGEGDGTVASGISVATYTTNFRQLVTNLRTQSWFPSTTPIFDIELLRTTGIAQYSTQNQAKTITGLDSDPYTITISSKDLIGATDAIHYTNAEMGIIADRIIQQPYFSQFQNDNSGTTYPDIYDVAQKVGINKPIPTVALDVVGDIVSTGTNTAQGFITEQGTATIGQNTRTGTGTNGGGLFINGGVTDIVAPNLANGVLEINGTTNQWVTLKNNGTVNGQLFANSTLFRTTATNDYDIVAGGLQRVVVKGATGFVGINKSNPLEALDVNGNVEISGTLDVLGVGTFNTHLVTNEGSGLFLNGRGSSLYTPSANRGLIELNGASDNIFAFKNPTGTMWGQFYSSPTLFRMHSSSGLDFLSGDAQRIAISSTGDIKFNDFTSATAKPVTAAGQLVFDNAGNLGTAPYEPAGFAVNTQLSPANAATATIDYALKNAVYQSINAPATMTLAYSNATVGGIHHIAIAPSGANSTVTFTNFFENGSPVTSKLFTKYTILTVRQLTATSAEIVDTYVPNSNTSPIPQGVVNALASAVQNVPMSVAVAEGVDISRYEVVLESGSNRFMQYPLSLDPTNGYSITVSPNRLTVNVTFPNALAGTEKVYVRVR